MRYDFQHNRQFFEQGLSTNSANCPKNGSTETEFQCGLKEYFVLFNVERSHQSLSSGAPGKVYEVAAGGGAGRVGTDKKTEHADRIN